MLDPRDLDVLVCHSCKRQFKDNDEIYTISRQKFFMRIAGFIQEEARCELPITPPLIIPRKIHFHATCFGELSGHQFLP